MFSSEGMTYVLTLLVIIGLPVWCAYRAVNKVKANPLAKAVLGEGGTILWKAMRK